MREAILLKMLPVQGFIRVDKSDSMLQAYHKLIDNGCTYAILSHHNMVDIGFVMLKDIVRFLAHKYIPDTVIKAEGALIEIKHSEE